MDDIRFPLGPFVPMNEFTDEARKQLIAQLLSLVTTLRSQIEGLSAEELGLRYRPGGWTIRQIVHHMADNDLNAYFRFKRALTEDEPLASSYREDLWASFGDYETIPVENSLKLMEGIHKRFAFLLHSMRSEDYHRKLTTAALGSITLDVALQRFVWHNRHHMAHIEAALRIANSGGA